MNDSVSRLDARPERSHEDGCHCVTDTSRWRMGVTIKELDERNHDIVNASRPSEPAAHRASGCQTGVFSSSD